MSKEERDAAIQIQIESIGKDTRNLNHLVKKRQELFALLREKSKTVEYELAKEVSQRREKESNTRIRKSCNAERQAQQITSALMMELMQICEEDDTPRYVIAIAKILDNYQGGINTIRSNSTWLSELISQLTDQMRNFDAGQKKIEARFDVLMEKVIKSQLFS